MSDEQPVPETLETIAASIRDLRAFVEARFTGTDNRLTGIDQRFDGVDQRLDGIDKRFDGVDDRFAGIDQRFDGIDQRFDGVDQRFDELKSQLKTEIESVRDDIRIVAEGFATQATESLRNADDHKKFNERLDRHDLRLLALEPKTPA